VLIAIITDQIFDNLNPTPDVPGVHPAAVLVAAIIPRLIGLIGCFGRPGLATLVLIGRYIIRKMLDLEPFPAPASEVRPEAPAWSLNTRRLRAWWRTIQRR
jgi:hypothetical protein